MAAVQAEVGRASFQFVGDLNGHHEWLCSMTTNHHGVAALDFTTVADSDQLVPTAHGRTLDHLITDAPDLAGVTVGAPIGNSDHLSLPEVILMVWAVSNLYAQRKVFSEILRRINLELIFTVITVPKLIWNTVCGAIHEEPKQNIRSADNPVEVLNELLSLPVGHYVPTKAIYAHNKDKPWFDDQCQLYFDLKQDTFLHAPVMTLELVSLIRFL